MKELIQLKKQFLNYKKKHITRKQSKTFEETVNEEVPEDVAKQLD